MKKKVLIGLLAIFLIVALVSCDEAGWDKLGELMGGMGNNVYGITPNMNDVEAVSGTITSSVSTTKSEDGTSTTVTINLNTASTIIQQLSEIGTSTQKLSQAKADLATPLSSNKEEAGKIQEALQKSIGDVIGNDTFKDENIEKISNDKVKNAAKEVKTALETIKNKIPENPTQADLATVVVINSLATQVTNLKDVDKENKDALIPLVDKALAALDALKVTTEVSDIDVLGEFDVMSLLGSLNSEEKSKDVSTDNFSSIIGQLENSLITLISQFATKKNGYYEFDQVKYDRFILQMTAVRTSYELASYGLLPSIDGAFIEEALKKLGESKEEKDETTNADENSSESTESDFFGSILTQYLSAIKGKNNFNTNDLVTYLLSVAATEMDQFGTELFDVAALEDSKTEEGETSKSTEETATEESSTSAPIENLFRAFLETNKDNLVGSSITTLDFSDFVKAYEAKTELDLNNIEPVFSDAFVLARTVLVIASESGADNFVAMFLPQGATIEQFLSSSMQDLYDYIQSFTSNGGDN